MPLPPVVVGHHNLDSSRDLCGSALLQLDKRGVPQRMQVLFSAVEPHLYAVAAAIFGEPGMKRLMDVANQVSDEPRCGPLLVTRRIG